jgi:uncharacterized OB-fold protein
VSVQAEQQSEAAEAPATAAETRGEARRRVLAKHVSQGRLAYQRCSDCRSAQFPPRVLCRSCGGRKLAWLISEGAGVVYSASAIPQRNADSRSVVLVDLDEGFRMMSSFVDRAAEEVIIGGRVAWMAPTVSSRAWAALTPDAFARDPVSIEDVLSSRMVSSPLSVLDCCLMTHGSAAVVVTAAERAGDGAKAPVYLLGAGEGHSHRFISKTPDLTTTAAAVESGRRAFTMAGLGPADVDLAELYDACTRRG